MDNELLSQDRCREAFETAGRAARAAGVADLEVMIGARSSALTRFANNRIHQNVAEKSSYLSVRAVIGQRTARATTNQLDQDSIRKAVEEAISVTRSSEPDPALLPLAEPARYTPVQRFHPETAYMPPAARGKAVADAIRVVESAGQTAAGIYETEQSVSALFNSRGLAAYDTESMAVFSITAMAADSSGWAKASSTDHNLFDPIALAARASRKAALSASPREIPPGRYTVVLEPAAVLDLVGQIFGDFSATAMQDKRSFLVDRLGKKIFGDNIVIHDDVYHPLQAGPAWDGEGAPRRKLKLVEEGTPRELARSRQAAKREGAEPTGHGLPLPNEHGEMPVNIVIAGGSVPLERMIASTERGILVTRLWYIREVEPYDKVMTGMTRDGTFLIEDGRVTCGLKNFRFNQSVVELLNHVEAMSPPERAAGEETFDMVVPAMKAGNFHFTEVTRF